MGLFDLLGSLFGRARRGPGPYDAPGFFSALLGENWSRLSGRPGAAKAVKSDVARWEAALSGERRILVVKARAGEQAPGAWLFYGGAAAERLARELREDLRPRDGGPAAIDLAAALVLADRLGEAVALAAARDGPPPRSSLCLEAADAESLPSLRWAVLDHDIFECRLEAGDFFLALAPDAASPIGAALSDPASGYAAAILGRAEGREGRPDPLAAIAPADEARRLDGPRSFPLARVLAERRLVVPGGEARLSPAELLVCATPAFLSSRAAGGYRVGLSLSAPGVEERATLRFLASPLGPYEVGSQEWRALVGALAARSSASIGALLGMEAKAASAGPARPAEALSEGPALAISYNVSFGGARGRPLVALDLPFLLVLAARLPVGIPAEGLELARLSPALAAEAIDAGLRRRGFPAYMRSLREAPPRASSVAARLPVGGRPLYAVIEEMSARDAAAAISKLVQKGFLLMEHRYAFFFHELPSEGSEAPAVATPCEDYEALFSRFPRRWDESDGARARLRAAFGDLDGLVEAHYEAAWTLYRELLADRLALSARGEALLRASGEAFSARLAEAIATQAGPIAAAVASMDAERRRAVPWADKARELCGCGEIVSSLAPLIGPKAVDSLRDAASRIEARLRDGREDAYALWKDRREFVGDLVAGGTGRGARRNE
jgi:hypothetical protein